MFRSIATIAITISAISVPLYADDASQGADQKQDEKKAVEPIEFRKLKTFLPESVGGIRLVNGGKGSKSSFGEAKVSQAEGDYSTDDGEASADVTIIDYGGIPGMAEGMAMWTKLEIDNESDDEYSKTVTYGNYKGLETYNLKNKSGSLQLLIGNRIIITISLEKLEPTEFAKTVEAMKLADLEALTK